MITNHSAEQRLTARTSVIDGLARLRLAFPLEARLGTAPLAAHAAYARILAHWLTGNIPSRSLIDAAMLETLCALDAIVPGPEGIGCYPFSARPTGISATLPGATLEAMCAVDALAIARLAGRRVAIHSHCAVCAAPLRCEVADDGSLDHDQADSAHVIWREMEIQRGSCSEHLCRNLLFLCPSCDTPANSTRFTLPQATAIGNAFFAFQRTLLAQQP